MPLKVATGGAERPASEAFIYIAGAKKRVTRIDAWNGSAWKVVQAFVLPLTLSRAPSGTITTDKVFDLELVISKSITVTPSGGLAPYTYAWTILSGAGVYAAVPTKATTTLRKTMSLGQSVSGSARCTVTDSLGTPASIDIPFNLVNTG